MSKVKDHCVIGLTCKTGIGRTWLATEQEAITHATELMVAKYRKSGYKNTKPVKVLAVVKVVRIVELDEPIAPPVRTRQMGINDVEEDRRRGQQD